MGKKLRQGDPWMPGFRYGALLPPLSINLMVIDVERSVKFYQSVFNAEVHYYDIDFGAARIGPVEVMLHADHTHDEHPWYPDLSAGKQRGLGLQLRVLGVDPDELLPKTRDMVGARCCYVTPMAMSGQWVCLWIRQKDPCAQPGNLTIANGTNFRLACA